MIEIVYVRTYEGGANLSTPAIQYTQDVPRCHHLWYFRPPSRRRHAPRLRLTSYPLSRSCHLMVAAAPALLIGRSIAFAVVASRSARNSPASSGFRSLQSGGRGGGEAQGRAFTSSASSLSATTNYLLKYDYVPDVLEKRGPYRGGHLDLAKQMIEDGRCLSGGPTGEPGMEVPSGALFVFSDLEAAESFVGGDPYVEHGIVTGHSIEEWNVVVQKE